MWPSFREFAEPQLRMNSKNKQMNNTKICTRCNRTKTCLEFTKDEIEFKRYNSCRERDRVQQTKLRNGEQKERIKSVRREAYKLNISKRLDDSKTSAHKRGKSWNITDDKAKELMTSPCHYCGLIELGVRVNGIDRVNNEIGYEEGNVVPCCKLCNYFKKDYTVEQFLGHAKRITEFQSSDTRKANI